MSFGPYWIGLAPFHPVSACPLTSEDLYGQLTWACQYCNRRFHSETAYCKHVRDSSAHKILCTVCHRLFVSQLDWTAHMRAEHQRPYICCGRDFDTIDKFCQHYNNAPSHAPIFSCYYHGRLFGHTAHLDCCKQGCELTYECKQCDTTCYSLANMSQHMPREHSPDTFLYNREAYNQQNPIRHGHYNAPTYLYRVQHSGSITKFDQVEGLSARSDFDPSRRQGLFHEILSAHCNWQAFQSPFISMFSDKQHARNWAGRLRGARDVFIITISVESLLNCGLRIWSVSEIDATMPLDVKNSNWCSDEWVCFDKIPSCAFEAIAHCS